MFKRNQAIIFVAGLCTLLAAGSSSSVAQVDPVWLGNWQEARKLRPDPLPIVGRIGPEDEPGVPLHIKGQILNPDGSPAAGVAVLAYHRDRRGYEFDPEGDMATWLLQGWAQTDGQGSFEFRTIRPATDRQRREPAHIHFTLESAEYGKQWAPKIFFADDPDVPQAQRTRSEEAGDLGAVRPVKSLDGVQTVSVLFQLSKEPDF